MRRMAELREEVGVKESFGKKLARSLLKTRRQNWRELLTKIVYALRVDVIEGEDLGEQQHILVAPTNSAKEVKTTST